MMKKPNIVFVFGDQWRAQATGYAGNPTVKTPHLDRFATESINLTQAVSGYPVCSPARASLLTGQFPLTHGVFVNDVHLDNSTVSIAQAFKQGGYQTSYIGKWHVDGHGRSNYIPPERRQGFEDWKVLECTHNYNQSAYYSGNSDQKLFWDGYDAIDQTKAAEDYIRQHRNSDQPFLLMISWGGPHAPYQTAPEEYRELYQPENIPLRPNVPVEAAKQAKEDIAGYYAHCTVLDDCMGSLLATIETENIKEDTIVVFTSDHGDMLGSQGLIKKQKPWEESIRIPFLLRYPALFDLEGKQVPDAMIGMQDMMPTLLGLSQLPIPEEVEGIDYSGFLQGSKNPSDSTALLACYHPFGQWRSGIDGGPYEFTGREFRGIRTNHHTYVRSLQGPWLLYDNLNDPYQLNNLVDLPQHLPLQDDLDQQLQRKLDQRKDQFLSGMEYINTWGYTVDERGTVPYQN
ncbi:sulfatase [Candidatus Poribacteria bacterium]|nr:sulfatase [Candidatus Poribacteria bacterium]